MHLLVFSKAFPTTSSNFEIWRLHGPLHDRVQGTPNIRTFFRSRIVKGRNSGESEDLEALRTHVLIVQRSLRTLPPVSAQTRLFVWTFGLLRLSLILGTALILMFIALASKNPSICIIPYMDLEYPMHHAKGLGMSRFRPPFFPIDYVSIRRQSMPL